LRNKIKKKYCIQNELLTQHILYILIVIVEEK